ncbi:MAG: cyclic nucleotide-binding domain-containing protein [Candidatus Latescibacterota bacterium]
MAKVVQLAASLVQQVPLFFGFTLQEMQRYMDASTLCTYQPGDVLCEDGSASNRLFVLLDGELEVLTRQNTAMAGIRPVSAVGETGFISRKPRTATVRAKVASRLLRTGYHEFEALAEKLPALRVKVYRNVIRVLSDRLDDANDLLLRYRRAQEAGIPAGAAEPPEPRADAAAPAGGDSGLTPDEDARADRLVTEFYGLVQVEVSPDQRLADRQSVLQLRRDGYTHADLEYAVKWAARNIPAIKRFGLVRLSIREAFQERWSG